MCTYVEITYQVEVEDMRLCKSISYIKLYMTDLYHRTELYSNQPSTKLITSIANCLPGRESGTSL